jgi:hypothetical protein
MILSHVDKNHNYDTFDKIQNIFTIIILTVPFLLYSQETIDIRPSDITKIKITTDNFLSYSGQKIKLLNNSHVQVIPRKQETIIPIESVYSVTITYIDSTNKDSSSLGSSVLKSTAIGAGIGVGLGLLIGDRSSGDVIRPSAAENALAYGIACGLYGLVGSLTIGLLKSDTSLSIQQIDMSEYTAQQKLECFKKLADSSKY